jgi:hypothetical protein
MYYVEDIVDLWKEGRKRAGAGNYITWRNSLSVSRLIRIAPRERAGWDECAILEKDLLPLVCYVVTALGPE